MDIMPTLEDDLRAVSANTDDAHRAITALERRVTALESRLAATEIDYGAPFNSNEECQRHHCSYYQHYLMHGPADLGHEAYHVAEKRCEEAQKVYLAWLDANEGNHRDPPALLERGARLWEQRIRA